MIENKHYILYEIKHRKRYFPPDLFYLSNEIRPAMR